VPVPLMTLLLSGETLNKSPPDTRSADLFSVWSVFLKKKASRLHETPAVLPAGSTRIRETACATHLAFHYFLDAATWAATSAAKLTSTRSIPSPISKRVKETISAPAFLAR